MWRAEASQHVGRRSWATELPCSTVYLVCGIGEVYLLKNFDRHKTS